ncbi:MAG: radical SAM protein [Lachnospiraceae bacterium]|nr:radical SAM protein [Lachnospiraceae bacterium]
MRYILDKQCRLRGWTDHLACLELYPERRVIDLSVKEYGLLSKCDGLTDVDEVKYAEAIRTFTSLGFIREADGTKPDPAQQYLFYENKRFRNMDICITGCCDFRCRHCFNAAENDRSRGTQPTTEQLLDLIARLDACGIANVTISGGEPLLHEGFIKLAGELARRDMHFRRLVTNLYHMTPVLADILIGLGHRPLISTSFDGLGTHEWLRQKEGSEKRALDNIAMLKEKGFHVRTHCCVWKDSMPVIRDTVLRLQELGVDEFRIMNIEPSLRWRENAGGQMIKITEWLDFVCGLLDWWYDNEIKMDLNVWSFWWGAAGKKYINILPESHSSCELADNTPACAGAYKTPYIDSDGRILLCNAIAGYTKAVGIDWGNVFRDDLHTLLCEGPFIDQCSRTIGQLKKQSPMCMQCKWARQCHFGCRAEALAYNGELNSPDNRMCVFFKQGYYQRFMDIADRHGLIYR